jgi:hypothetical protein
VQYYKVRITALVETTNIVEADSREDACLLAENDWAENFVVLNTYSNEHSSFTEIIGYEPERGEGMTIKAAGVDRR